MPGAYLKPVYILLSDGHWPGSLVACLCSFKIYSKWSVQTNKKTSIDTHMHTQCSHASVGLAQAHPNYSNCSDCRNMCQHVEGKVDGFSWVYILVHSIYNSYNTPTSRIPFCTDAIQFPICLSSNMGTHVGNIVVLSNTHPVYGNTGPGPPRVKLCCMYLPIASVTPHHLSLWHSTTTD